MQIIEHRYNLWGPMIYGYARTSTSIQDLGLEKEIEALKEYGVNPSSIFSEQHTATTLDRPALKALLSKVDEGDTVVVTSLDRLSRKLTDLLSVVDGFREHGVNLVSMKENIDTSTPQGVMFLQMTGVFAEFEREMISQRTKEALEVARANGRVGGRPKTDPASIEAAVKLYRQGEMTVSSICRACGISRPTFYKYKKEHGL